MRHKIDPNQISLFDFDQNRGTTRERERERDEGFAEDVFFISLMISYRVKIYLFLGESFLMAKERGKMLLSFH
jgi:hypothetical protein